MKLSDRISDRNNNFNLFRFGAASFVFIQHSFDLTSAPLHWFFARILWASVPIFIIISGFLVTKSWAESRPGPFFLKRFLRIFPALLCATLFAAFVIGPLVTAAPLSRYMNHPLTLDYLKNIFLYPIYYYLPGVFNRNPVPMAVNGSLWTLPIEVFLYGVLAVIGLAKVLPKRPLGAVLIVCSLLCLDLLFDAKLTAQPLFLFTMPAKYLLSLSIYFFIGSLYYLYRSRIPLHAPSAAIALILLLVTFKYPVGNIASYLLLPYIVIQFAYTALPGSALFRKVDLSYGIYVYAFPLQQTAIHFFNGSLPRSLYFPAAFGVLLILSYLSWRYVEKPCMGLKKRWEHDRSSAPAAFPSMGSVRPAARDPRSSSRAGSGSGRRGRKNPSR